MQTVSYTDIIKLAYEIGDKDLMESVDKRLEKDDLRGARITILGYLDCQTFGRDNPVFTALSFDAVKSFYKRLGFSTDELVRFRTSSLSKPVIKEIGLS